MPPLTQALTDFGEAAAKLPFDAMRVRQALAGVEKHGGQEQIVEAVGTMMAFEAITKVVDATSRVDPPYQAVGNFIANMVVSVNKARESISKNSTQVALASTAVLVIGIAYGLYSKAL